MIKSIYDSIEKEEKNESKRDLRDFLSRESTKISFSMEKKEEVLFEEGFFRGNIPNGTALAQYKTME